MAPTWCGATVCSKSPPFSKAGSEVLDECLSTEACALNTLRLKGGGGSPTSHDGSEEWVAYHAALQNNHDCVPNSASGSDYFPTTSSEEAIDDDYISEVRPLLHAT